jgi:hypothetical protein
MTTITSTYLTTVSIGSNNNPVTIDSGGNVAPTTPGATGVFSNYPTASLTVGDNGTYGYVGHHRNRDHRDPVQPVIHRRTQVFFGGGLRPFPAAVAARAEIVG